MEFKKIISDDEAVSPVIGVILMVAITVILAAVIGTFVLGLGDQVSNTAPTASFTFDQGTYQVGGAGTEYPAVTVTHDGGDKIEAANINILIDGVEAYADDGSGVVVDPYTSEVSAGSSTTIVAVTSSSVDTGTDTFNDNTNDLQIQDGDGTAYTYSNTQLTSDQTLRVTWSSSNGEDTATLGKFTLN